MMPFNPNQQQQFGNQQFGQQPNGAPAPFNPGAPAQSTATPLAQTPADMQFLDIDLGYDPQADANALLPPVLPTEYLFGNATDGYQCVVEFAESDPSKRFMKSETKASSRGPARPYAYCELMLVIQNCTKNPAMNGRRIPYRAMSLVSEGMKTNGMQALIQATSKANELNTMPRTLATLLNLIVQIVNSKTVLSVMVDWEATFYDKEAGKDIAPRIRGWRNFMNPQTQQLNEEITINVNTPLGPKAETRKPRPSVRFITWGTQAPRQAVNMASFQQQAPPVVQPVQQPVYPPSPVAPGTGVVPVTMQQPVQTQQTAPVDPQQMVQQPPPFVQQQQAPTVAPQQPQTAQAPNLAALFG